MSRLKVWHVLVPTLILAIGAPVGGYFGLVQPRGQAIDGVRTQITQAQDKAIEKLVKEAELEQAKGDSARFEKELLRVKSLKSPVGAGNPWWHSVRYGAAFTPGPARIRMGGKDQVVDLPDGYAMMMDAWYEYREDLGPILRAFFDSTGVAVSQFSLPAPEIRPYTIADILRIQLTGTGLSTVGVPDIRGAAQASTGTMAVQGKYENVLKFFRRVGEAPRLLAVEGPVEIRPVPETGGREVVATMRMTVYILPNVSPEVISQLASALGALGAAGGGTGGRMGGPGGMMGGPGGMMGMGGAGGMGGPMMSGPAAGPSGGGGAPASAPSGG